MPSRNEKAEGNRDDHIEKEDGEVDRPQRDGLGHRALVVTRAWGGRSIESGLRSGRPKPSKETLITSPVCSRTRSRKLKWSAPKKWMCTSPGRRCWSYLKWWCSRLAREWHIFFSPLAILACQRISRP